jgi:hypothetical protein
MFDVRVVRGKKIKKRVSVTAYAFRVTATPGEILFQYTEFHNLRSFE